TVLSVPPSAIYVLITLSLHDALPIYLNQKTCASSAGSVLSSLAIGMRLRRASLCHAPLPRAISLLQFVPQSHQDWNRRQHAHGEKCEAGTASFLFFQSVAQEKTDTNAQRAARHRDQPNLGQRQSDAFRTNV